MNKIKLDEQLFYVCLVFGWLHCYVFRLLLGNNSELEKMKKIYKA